jgi:hypothetical protein
MCIGSLSFAYFRRVGTPRCNVWSEGKPEWKRRPLSFPDDLSIFEKGRRGRF